MLNDFIQSYLIYKALSLSYKSIIHVTVFGAPQRGGQSMKTIVLAFQTRKEAKHTHKKNNFVTELLFVSVITASLFFFLPKPGSKSGMVNVCVCAHISICTADDLRL